MAGGAQNCHMLQQALVLFYFAFDDSLAAREGGGCLPTVTEVQCPCPLQVSPSTVNYSSAPEIN